MPVPVGVEPNLSAYLQGLEDRVSALENPGSPTAMFAVASTSLTTALAALFPNCEVFLTDLKVPGCSDGVHWFRSDTGAQIV